MPMRSAWVALACSRLGLAASAAATWAVDDSSALLQRYAEEDSSEGPDGFRLRVVPYKELWDNAKKQFSAMIPPQAKKKNKAAMEHVAKAAMASAAKATQSATVAMEALKSGEMAAEHKLKERRKQLVATRPRLWRKEKNSTDYGVMDGIIEATRQRIHEKNYKNQMKILSKASEMGRNMISTLPQPMMPGFTPVVPVKSVAEPGAPTPMTADDMAMAVESYRKQLRDSAQKVRELKKERSDEEEPEQKEDVEERKEDERELKADQAKEQATAAEQREKKRRADTQARQAARQRRRQEKDDAFPKHLFEEGVE